ncbi:hypothetical protein E2320_001435, partial [Naja naja]
TAARVSPAGLTSHYPFNSLTPPSPGPPSPGEEEGEEEEAAGEAGEAESRAHLGEVQHPQLVEPLLGSHRGARSPRQARPPRSVALTPAGQRCRPPSLLHASAPDSGCAALRSCWPASLAPPPPPPDSQPGRAPGRRSGRSAGAPLGRPAAPPAFTRPSSDGEVALRAAMRSTLGWPPLASSIGDSALVRSRPARAFLRRACAIGPKMATEADDSEEETVRRKVRLKTLSELIGEDRKVRRAGSCLGGSESGCGGSPGLKRKAQSGNWLAGDVTVTTLAHAYYQTETTKPIPVAGSPPRVPCAMSSICILFFGRGKRYRLRAGAHLQRETHISQNTSGQEMHGGGLCRSAKGHPTPPCASKSHSKKKTCPKIRDIRIVRSHSLSPGWDFRSCPSLMRRAQAWQPSKKSHRWNWGLAIQRCLNLQHMLVPLA